tara:strand:+ start:1044 stop:1484 length:441 start_codon:yes stop_codon:yes gene_type:complete
MLIVAAEFLQWAARHEINPRHWIIARHDAIKWCRRIPLKDLTLPPDSNFRQSYQEWIGNKLAALDQEVLDRKSVESDTSRVTELTVLGEASKAAFREEPEVCLGSAQTLTGGWHPDSVWCSKCSLAADCRSDLSANVRRRRSYAGC